MKKKPRQTTVERKTRETQIKVSLNLDGGGKADVATGVGFLDHMLALLAAHGRMDLTVRAEGDLQVDQHHTAEDVGICLGQALLKALGEKTGIRRFGYSVLPMQEALVTVALDLSGRPFVVWKLKMPTEKIGQFDAELVEEFWRAVANHAGMNLHVLLHHGRNSHHIAEAVFKGAARALGDAVAVDPRLTGVPSTKGTL